MRLYRTRAGVVLEHGGTCVTLPDEWNQLIMRDDLAAYLETALERNERQPGMTDAVLPPIDSQEVWAAGVTYRRSKDARIEESKDAGGGSFYDRVYDAPRPELFFKSPGWRVRGPGDSVRIRADAKWSVPEPEIALCINPRARIVGYTIGNDMSSRDIEGANPLYLPQAKIYDGSCALGPALLVADALAPETVISLRIRRDGASVFSAQTEWARMKRDPRELAAYLYAELSFPCGCVLLTGTGIVPPDDFSLQAGDEIEISVPPIGTLGNVVAEK